MFILQKNGDNFKQWKHASMISSSNQSFNDNSLGLCKYVKLAMKDVGFSVGGFFQFSYCSVGTVIANSLNCCKLFHIKCLLFNMEYFYFFRLLE